MYSLAICPRYYFSCMSSSLKSPIEIQLVSPWSVYFPAVIHRTQCAALVLAWGCACVCVSAAERACLCVRATAMNVKTRQNASDIHHSANCELISTQSQIYWKHHGNSHLAVQSSLHQQLFSLIRFLPPGIPASASLFVSRPTLDGTTRWHATYCWYIGSSFTAISDESRFFFQSTHNSQSPQHPHQQSD
jgi:hypothetical protein